jgi:DNA polymerase-3 subunit delta'
VTEQSAVTVPMPWHTDAWRHLGEQLASDRLPHALLLAGTEYTGKSRLAMALAKLLLCAEPVAGHNCGQCHACEMARAGSHGDFRWLQPEDKSRVIKIDQVRDVVNFGTMTASFGKRKVVVFAPAEAMNPNAANALLKSLEEPTRESYMLLVSHRLHGLPATIRSRCQLLRLPPPTRDQSLDWLEQLTGSREDSERLLALADGQPLLAERLYQEADLEAVAAIPQVLEMLQAGKATVPEAVALLNKLTLEEALGRLGRYLQGAIITAGQGGDLAGPTRKYFLLLDEVNRLKGAVQSGANPNPQLLLESLLARFQKELAR